MSKQFRADLLLLVIVASWGSSYYMTDLAMTEVTPLALNAIRFLSAFTVAAVFSLPRLKKISSATLRRSLLNGVTLTLTYLMFTLGIQRTTLSKSAFFCSLAVIMIPVIEFICYRRKPSRVMGAALLLSVLGIALMTIKAGFTLNLSEFAGDLFCMACSFFYAVNVLLTERAVRKEDVDPFQLGLLQLGITGLLMLIFTLCLEQPTMPHTPRAWLCVIFLAVFCTGLAFIAQPIAQQYTTAQHAGIIFTLEPVFAAVVAYFLAGELLSGRELAGAGLMLAAFLLAELGPTDQS